MQTNLTAGAPPASSTRTEIAVNGMTCSGCARNVNEAIQSVPGVASAMVSLEQKQATVRWASGKSADVQAVVEAIRKAGYEASPVQNHPETHHHGADVRASVWSGNVLFGVVPTVLLMMGEWVFRLGEAGWYRWVSFVVAAIVQFGPGRHFYRGAWNQIKAGRSNMDTLVALGSTTAFAHVL